MFNDLKKLRIQQRLKKTSIISVSLAGFGSLLAIITMMYMINQYSRVLNYYAFPQGDIGHAMAALADVRSATRGAIGYEKQEQIDKMIAAHDKKVVELREYMDTIAETIISEEGKADYEHIMEHIDEYMEIDAQILEDGTSKEAERYEKAHERAFSEMAPAYEEAYSALQGLMDTNTTLGEARHKSLQIMDAVLTFIIIALVVFG